MSNKKSGPGRRVIPRHNQGRGWNALEEMKMTLKQLLALSEKERNGLTALDIGYNSIGDEGAALIASSLPLCKIYR